jgi:hypothetical protein
VSTAPPAAAAYGVRRIVQGSYRGPQAFQVTVYEVKPGTAFEVMQKCRREDGQFPFYTKNFLVVVEAPAHTTDRATLDRFSRALEQGLPDR